MRTIKKTVNFPILFISHLNTHVLLTYQKFINIDIKNNLILPVFLWGEVIRIPVNHRLLLYSHLYKNYSTNLRRVSSYIGRKYKSFCAIDVGANIGDSAILIRQGSNPSLICIEGDNRYASLLHTNLKSYTKTKILEVFVGERKTSVKASVVTNFGTGTISYNSDALLDVDCLDNIIKTKKSIKLLKIDTDGYEYSIIKGSKKLISSHKPVLFVEFDRNRYKLHGESDFDFITKMYNWGYKYFLIYDNFGKLIQGYHMKKPLQIKDFKKMFNYKKADYYDLVLFTGNDVDLYNLSLKEEREYFMTNK